MVDLMAGLPYMLSYLGIQELGEKTETGETLKAQTLLAQNLLNIRKREITPCERSALLAVQHLLANVAIKQLAESHPLLHQALSEDERIKGSRVFKAAKANIDLEQKIKIYLASVPHEISGNKKEKGPSC